MRPVTSTVAAFDALALLLCLGAAAQGAALSLWAVDPHVKVFRDTPPAAGAGPIRLRAARNESESAQIAVRSAEAVPGLTVRLSPLAQEGGAQIPADCLAWHFVGFIPLSKNTPHADRLRLRAAPCEVPDPLLETRSLDLPANTTQPVWLTVRVPEDAAPGLYAGQVEVAAGESRAAVPIELRVDPFALPDERHLLVTNWFDAAHLARTHKVEPWSEAHWALLARYAANLAAHRQNVVWVPWRLIEVARDAEGQLAFDFARFDRFCETFLKAGAADRLEIRHVGHFGKGGWSGREIVLSKVPATDRKTGKTVHLDPDEGLLPLLAALQDHLADRGWLERAMIHIADEPSLNNIASWRQASALVHQAAPRLRRIDAIETIDFAGALEVWVPKLSHLDRWRSAYEARRGDGEFWFYICCHPYGDVYPNRFLDYPLTAVRVLHWINFAEDLAGYLHWGLAFWRDDPFGVPDDRLPPGDTHVIYPGADGPLSSIRWEIQRESIEDFELLHLLAARTAALKDRLGPPAAFLHPDRRARELARRVVPAITAWERDPARIQGVRHQVADEIVALDAEPLLLVETEPPAGATLVNGPIVVEVRGVTRPGASVKVNGRAATVGPDGAFATPVHGGGAAEIRIQAEHDGHKKTAMRHFRVEP